MQVEGERSVKASRGALWRAIHDPKTLTRILPACKSVTGTAESGFTAKIVPSIGPVQLNIECRIEVTDAEPERSVSLRATGSNFIARGAGADLTLRFADAEDGTTIHYVAEGRMNAALKRVAGGIVDNVTERMAENFCKRLEKEALGHEAA